MKANYTLIDSNVKIGTILVANACIFSEPTWFTPLNHAYH